MNADASTSPGPGFHGRLLARLRDFLSEHPEAPFSEIALDGSADGERAHVFVESHRAASLVIGVERDTTNPRAHDPVTRARDCARDLDADLFATCNANDFFLFDEGAEPGATDADYYYLDLRTRSLTEAVRSILGAAGHRHREGGLPDQPRRDKLAGTLRSFHDSVWPAFQAAASDAYGGDREFTAAFEEWIDENSRRDRDRSEQFEMAAKEYAYLLMNRILRYEALRRRSDPATRGSPTTADDGRSLETLSRTGRGEEPSPRRIEDHLRESFDDLTAENDHRSTLAPGSELLGSFPHSGETRQGVLDLIRNIESVPAAEIDEGVLGEIYEELIPEDERGALGQFYTPPAIVEALVRWSLRAGGDGAPGDGDIPRVLDPAAGSGAFVVEAYDYLAEQFPEASHRELLDHVLAVDVSRIPLRLAAIDLAGRGAAGGADHVRAYHSSFFDLDPTTGAPPDSRIGTLDDGGDGGGIGTVDAVVGNPPYIEAGDLSPDKAHFRDHLGEFGPGDSTPYLDGSKGIGANADAYVYFLTHATQFLREGGRLGFVVPTKWMMSRYGEQFQGFLHDHYRIEAVVGFDARAFGDALVDTALVLLEKCSDDPERRENVVELDQLHDTVSTDNLLETIDHGCEVPAGDELTVSGAEGFRTVGVRQSYLEDAKYGKIAHYLVAPEDLIELVESPELTELGGMADITRGAMTGSTAFFFPEGEDIEAHGIEDRFLRPALKSMRGYETVVYEEGDVDRWFVDVHEYVEEVRNRPDGRLTGGSLEENVKTALEEDGYAGLRSWIRRAETEDEHRGATCRSRDVWFDFGEPPRPDILFQKLLRERLFSIYNRVGAAPSNAVDCIDVHDDVDSKALFGVLNSSITQATMEVWGRNEAGMLQLMTYETESLPVPDVRSMSRGERSAIVSVVDDILERGDSELSAAHRDRLDVAVLDALDLSVELSVERVQEIKQSMLDRRIGSGDP